MACNCKETIIKLSNVNFSCEDKEILNNVDLEVKHGDFIAVTGPNGGGKTTLLRLILKLLKPTTGCVQYFSDNVPVNALSIGYLPQKNMIDSHFPILLEEVIASGMLSCKDLSKKEIEEHVDAMLELVGLTSHRHHPIGQLSGGQLQRGLLGRALISSPDVLVLDEPLSYIDKHFEKQMYDIIEKEAQHSTIILVSHEMSTIASMANRHIIVDHRLLECHAAHHYVRCDCD
ncbi:MAG: ATP-binding cassette domain-containing protein [Muribaculaceae bacterium]|nr:ATP-binding cassette domain-containing protein [Muribaculaceae bacterium]